MSIFINPLIKVVIRYPKFMETALFKKVMYVFPNMIAKRYDKSMVNRQGYDLALNEGLRCLEFESNYDGKILDLCTGSGFASLATADVFPKAKIIGIDQSQKMLDLARQKAVSSNINNVEFLKDDASNLSFKDTTFDLVIVSNAPFYFNEVVKVLKPSGYFLISVSFGGKGIAQNKKRIEEYLQKYNLKVNEIKQVKDGAFIISSLEN